MGLYQKYRPKELNEIVGNKDIVNSLQSYVENGTLPNAVLLSGTTGCGKTTFARIIADNLKAAESEITELDIAHFTGVDMVREMRRTVGFKPTKGEVRVWIIDEVHQMTKAGQNALLKLLEDPPIHVYFILVTTEPNRLIRTVRNRAVEYAVKPLDERKIVRLLTKISKEEEFEIEKQVIKKITEMADGVPREAIQLLEQVVNTEPESRMEFLENVTGDEMQSIELCRTLMKGSAWKSVANILKDLKGEDPERIRRHVLAYASSVLLNSANDRAALIIEEFEDNIYSSGFPGLVFMAYSVVKG